MENHVDMKQCLWQRYLVNVKELTTKRDTLPPLNSTGSHVMNIAAQNSWQIKQLDIKTAYLNANVDADIFMKQAEGTNL